MTLQAEHRVPKFADHKTDPNHDLHPFLGLHQFDLGYTGWFLAAGTWPFLQTGDRKGVGTGHDFAGHIKLNERSFEAPPQRQAEGNRRC